MREMPWQTMLVVLALFLLLPAAAAAQQGKKTSAPNPSDPQHTNATKAPGKLPLRSVMLVNTTEAARKAAQEASAGTQLDKSATPIKKHSASSKPAEGAVLEFRPTEETPTVDSSKETFQVKDHKKTSALRNIHGSAYGIAASGIGRASGEGGAVGADSRGGKINVYLEGEHTNGSTPGSR